MASQGRGRGEPKTSSRRTAARLKAIQAVELRRSGLTYMQIGRLLRVCESQAYRLVDGELARMSREPTEAVRNLELLRLDRLLMAHWDGALRGDPVATDRVLKIMDRRARYLGLDAPARIDLRAELTETAARLNLPEDETRALVEDAEQIIRDAQSGSR